MKKAGSFKRKFAEKKIGFIVDLLAFAGKQVNNL